MKREGNGANYVCYIRTVAHFHDMPFKYDTLPLSSYSIRENSKSPSRQAGYASFIMCRWLVYV